MGVDKNHPSFQFFHLPNLHSFNHHEKWEPRDIPKGCMAVIVGRGDEQHERFVIPVSYVNHPLFVRLLKEAEEEFGFDQKGPITIPCHVAEFRSVQDSIDRENMAVHGHPHGHHGHGRCF